MTNENEVRQRRFSEGMEHDPSLPASARVGSFATGTAMTADGPTGSFAGGMALRPDAPAARRVGTFADTVTPPAQAVDRARSRRRMGPSRLRPRTA